jgi:hypothetical protein
MAEASNGERAIFLAGRGTRTWPAKDYLPRLALWQATRGAAASGQQHGPGHANRRAEPRAGEGLSRSPDERVSVTSGIGELRLMVSHLPSREAALVGGLDIAASGKFDGVVMLICIEA